MLPGSFLPCAERGNEPGDEAKAWVPFSVFVVKLQAYGFCLSIAYIARRRHPYIESLPGLSDKARLIEAPSSLETRPSKSYSADFMLTALLPAV